MQAVTSALIGKKTKVDRADRAISSMMSLSQPYFDLVRDLLRTLLGTDYSAGRQSNVDDFITNVSGHSDYNKESLETMWRMRHILKMKMWNSWQYKYVAIVDMDITKEGTEDGVYEATLTFQEMPIVTMYAKDNRGIPSYAKKNLLLEKRGEIAIRTLDGAGGILGR